VLGCGVGARPVGAACVVGVLPVRNGIQPVFGHQLVVDPGEQLVLAEEAAIRAVGAVFRAVALMGLDLDHGRTDEAGDFVGRGPFGAGQAGRDAENRDHPVGTEIAHRRGQQNRRVDTTGEGDPQPADTGELPVQSLEVRVVTGIEDLLVDRGSYRRHPPALSSADPPGVRQC
jgi:hypothetical protein